MDDDVGKAKDKVIHAAWQAWFHLPKYLFKRKELIPIWIALDELEDLQIAAKNANAPEENNGRP